MSEVPRTSWTTVSRPSPCATPVVAACTDPRTQRACLAVAGSTLDDDEGPVELWTWADDHWERMHRGLFAGDPYGSTLLLFPWTRGGPPGLRVALGCAGGVLRVIDPDDPTGERRWVHPVLPAYAPQAWAFEDARAGHVWILVGGDASSSLFRWRGDVLELVATGPVFVCAAFDEDTSTLVAQTVGDRSHVFAEAAGRWADDPVPADKLDALVWDPPRRAIVGLRVASEARMDVVVRGPDGWRPAAPAQWVAPFRNGMTLVADVATATVLAHGGQDFENRHGDPSRETHFGREGQLRSTWDPALPPDWGRYNTLLCTDLGLVSLNHASLRVHRRTAESWEWIGQLRIPGVASPDDRGINAAWGGGAAWVVDSEGRVLRWDPRTDETTVLVGPNRVPGSFYAHRVALGFDGRTGALTLCTGKRKRGTFRLGAGGWEAWDPQGRPVAAVPTGAGTPEGLYVLVDSGLHLLRDGGWTQVGPNTEHACFVLRFEPRRRALVAATPDGASVFAEGGWRPLADLPDPARLRTMGSGSAELGIDPVQDAFVLCDEDHLWSLPLDGLDWRGCALPTDPQVTNRR